MDSFTGLSAAIKWLPKKGMNNLLSNAYVQFCVGTSLIIYVIRWW